MTRIRQFFGKLTGTDERQEIRAAQARAEAALTNINKQEQDMTQTIIRVDLRGGRNHFGPAIAKAFQKRWEA